MNTTEDVILLIERIDWFQSVGTGHRLDITVPIQVVGDWRQAIECLREPLWDDILIEARNGLTRELSAKHRQEDRKWNNISAEVRARLEQVAWPRVSEVVTRMGLPDFVTESVRWDTANAVMETAYAYVVPRGFYTQLLQVYVAGRFPCGWVGKWPQGSLCVY